MAYIYSLARSQLDTASTSFTATLPSHAENDLLLACIHNDFGNTTIAMTGWTLVDTTSPAAQAITDFNRHLFFWKKAGPSETNPPLTGASGAWGVTIFCIKDADTTTPIHKVARSAYTAGYTIAAPTVTTTNNDCLIIHSCSQDGNFIPYAGHGNVITRTMHQMGSAINSNLSCVVCGSTTQDTAGASPSFNWISANNVEAGVAWTIAINNATSGKRDISIASGPNVLRAYNGKQEGTYSTPASVLSTAQIASTLTSSTSITPDVNSTVTGWKRYGARFSSTEQCVTITAGSFVVGREYQIKAVGTTNFTLIGASANTVGINFVATGVGSGTGTAYESIWAGMLDAITCDLTNAVVAVQWGTTSSPQTKLGSNGAILLFIDNAGTPNWAAFRVKSKSDIVAGAGYQAIVDVDNYTPYASSGTIDWANIRYIGFLYHRLAPDTFGVDPILQLLMTVDDWKIVGGSASKPINAINLEDLYEGYAFPLLIGNQGGGQVLLNAGVQFGDGTTATTVVLTGCSVEVPLVSQTGWFVAPLSQSITLYGTASCVFDFSSSIIATGTAQNFVIHASSSPSASYNFNNATLQGWTVADNIGISWSSTAFKSGGTVTIAGGGDLTNCSITGTTSANAALSVSANGTTIDSTTIDVTGTSAAYHLELGTAVTAITLTDVTFAGTPGTDKVHVLKTTGTVTITISGTTSLVAADVTSAGATVVIDAPSPTLSATVLSGSRVVLYNNTTATELDNTSPAGTSWSKTITSGASSGDTLTLYVFKEGYEEFSTSFLYSGSDTTLLVSQTTHASIQSLRTELGITDYTTITEFILDITGAVEIDADDADGNTQKARFAIWYNGVLTTENGARYLRGALSVLSTAAFRINTSVLDLKFENISVTYGLNFTDTERRLYRDDGAPIYAAASAPGSIQNDYSGVPDTVETGVSGLTGSESAQLMGLPSAASTATAVLSAATTTPIAANIKQVNSLSVDGSGTEADPWGPA